jgi:UDP-4-amino-4,6-dideoxy-N-acetyl-beta-L-altrosamine transaminase
MVPRRDFLPYGRQLIEPDDIEAVVAVLNSDYLTTGPAVEAFEAEFCAETGAAYAIACSSGTAALHLAMLGLGIGRGATVIVPSITFVATANAPRLAGAGVVFADVDPDSGLMTVDTLRDAFIQAGRPVACVLPVHYAGQSPEMPALRAVAAEHGALLVEDACHALGAEPAWGGGIGDCRFSEAACFSLHPVKTIAAGEGGVVTTNDGDLAERLRMLRAHGICRDPARFGNTALARDRSGDSHPWYYELHDVGLNYRLSDINAALARSQLGKLDRFAAERRRLAARYDAALAPVAPAVAPLARTNGGRPCWHLYVALIDFDRLGLDRAELMIGLRRAGIGTQVHYIPVHLQPYYAYAARPGTKHRFPGAERFYARCLSLPLFVGMTDADVDHVVACLDEFIAAAAE